MKKKELKLRLFYMSLILLGFGFVAGSINNGKLFSDFDGGLSVGVFFFLAWNLSWIGVMCLDNLFDKLFKKVKTKC